MPRVIGDIHDDAISSSEEKILLTHEESVEALKLVNNFCIEKYNYAVRQSTDFFNTNGNALKKNIFTNFKYNHRKDDSLYWYLNMLAYNKVVDLVEANFNLLERGISNLFYQIPSQTRNALDPYNFMICAMNTGDVKKYFMQRFDQITTPLQYYQDFRGTWNRRSNTLNYSFQNTYENFSKIEGSIMNPTRKITHSCEIIYDLSNNFVAEKLGIFLSVFGLFNLSPFRRRTNTAMNHLFPKSTYYGSFAQSFPVKFLITKRMAKLYGNPVLSLVVGTYLIGMHVGQHLKDSYELKQKNPNLHSRLQQVNRDLTNSSFHISFNESAQKTAQKK